MLTSRLLLPLLSLGLVASQCHTTQQLGSSPETATASARVSAAPYEYDLIFRNGQVIDGTGKARFRADVGVKGDVITAIGDLASATGAQSIDASNRIVAPGFIDLLGQSQRSVFVDPHLEGKIRQGVTTEVTGEGHSPAPVSDAMAELQTREDPEVPVTWRSVDDFIRAVEKNRSAVNFAFYIGASNPRSMVIGEANRAPAADELRRMQEIVDQAMRDGAVGLTTSLIYVPAVFSTTEEIVALMKVAGKYGVGYFTHLRNEADGIDAALTEAFRIGREADVPVNIFHIKVGGRRNWGKMPAVVARIQQEQKQGRDVAANIYPYTASATSLSTIVPGEMLDGGYANFLQRLKDPTTRAATRDQIAQAPVVGRVNGPHGILISRIPNPAFARYERKRLDEIAAAMQTTFPEAALRLFEAGLYSPTAIFFSISEEDMKFALKQPWVAVGSDSGSVVGKMREQGAHPRAYGTFARILGHYVRDEKVMTLEEAVRKMTSLAASRVNFTDRGVLAVGRKADIVVFDPSTVRDVSTYEDPHHFSEGVSDVFVNGVAVLHQGKMTESLPGRVLRGPGYKK